MLNVGQGKKIIIFCVYMYKKEKQRVIVILRNKKSHRGCNLYSLVFLYLTPKNGIQFHH